MEPPDSGSALRRMFLALRIASFRTLWIGMVFSTAAMQMNIVVRAWLAYDLTGSGLAIGLVAVARGLPRFFIAPFGGVAADRLDKRMLLVLTQVIRIALALILGVLVFTGRIQIWHLMVAGLFQGISSAFMMPTRTAFISVLVGEEKLSNAIALDATGRNLNRIVAPAIAGLLIALDPSSVYFVIAAGYAVATLTLRRLPEGKPEDDGAAHGVLADAKAGFRYIWEQQAIFMVMAVALAVIFLGMPYRSFLPVFQEDVLNVGPEALGVMYAMVGIGAVVASLAVAYFAESDRKQQFLLGAGILFGLSLTTFALSANFIVALGVLTVVGFAGQTYLTLTKTILMTLTDRRYYGRVMSIWMMGFSLLPLAMLPFGAAVDAAGAPATFVVVGLALATAVVIGTLVQGFLLQRHHQASVAHQAK